MTMTFFLWLKELALLIDDFVNVAQNLTDSTQRLRNQDVLKSFFFFLLRYSTIHIYFWTHTCKKGK